MRVRMDVVPVVVARLCKQREQVVAKSWVGHDSRYQHTDFPFYIVLQSAIKTSQALYTVRLFTSLHIIYSLRNIDNQSDS